jgi:hypothetical protein
MRPEALLCSTSLKSTPLDSFQLRRLYQEDETQAAPSLFQKCRAPGKQAGTETGAGGQVSAGPLKKNAAVANTSIKSRRCGIL